jgi:hypothetical protein
MILMRRRDHDQSRTGRAPDPFRDDQPLVIYWNRDKLCASSRERPSGLDEAGLLDPHRVARIEDHPAAEITGARRAGSDHHLFRRADEPANRTEEVRDLAAQLWMDGLGEGDRGTSALLDLARLAAAAATSP